MSSTDPFQYYNPKHQIRYDYVPVKEAYLNNKVTSDYYNYNFTSDTSTKYKIIGYDVTLTYTGSANLGFNKVLSRRIENNYNSSEVIQAAIQATGISPYDQCCVTAYSSPAIDCFRCISFITCTCCLTMPCQNCLLENRREEFEKKQGELSEQYRAQEIAGLIKEADEIVESRIQSKEHVEKRWAQTAMQPAAQPAMQPTRQAGMVAISQAQLAELLQQAAKGITAAGNVGFNVGASHATATAPAFSPAFASGAATPSGTAIASGAALTPQYKRYDRRRIGEDHASAAYQTPASAAAKTPLSISVSRI